MLFENLIEVTCKTGNHEFAFRAQQLKFNSLDIPTYYCIIPHL